jgi:hypothetical protein
LFICDQIIPADDFPSASQAGVLTYIDKQLVRHFRRHQDAYRDGLEKAEKSAASASAAKWLNSFAAAAFEIVSALEQQAIPIFSIWCAAHLAGLLRLAAPRRQSRRRQLADAGPG